MKRIIMFATLSLILASWHQDRFYEAGEKEKKFISEFLDFLLRENNDPNPYRLYEFFSPEFLISNDIDFEYNELNSFPFVGYEVKSFDESTGEVTCLIWGDNKNWVHELVFQLAVEKGFIYIVPTLEEDDWFGYDWVNPWKRVKNHVSYY